MKQPSYDRKCLNVFLHLPPPKSNISKAERKAIHELKKEQEIIILPADKGKATVLKNAEDYELKLFNMLEDEKT